MDQQPETIETPELAVWKRFIEDNNEAGFYKALAYDDEVPGFNPLVICEWAARRNRSWFVGTTLQYADLKEAPEFIAQWTAYYQSLSMLDVYLLNRTEERGKPTALLHAVYAHADIIVYTLLFDMGWKYSGLQELIPEAVRASTSPKIRHMLWCYENPVFAADPWVCYKSPFEDVHAVDLERYRSSTPRGRCRPRNSHIPSQSNDH